MNDMKNSTGKKRVIEHQKSALSIKEKLKEAGISVHVGEKLPKHGQYSGIIGKSKKILKLKI